MPDRGRRGARRRVSASAEWALRVGLFLFCAFPLYWMLVSSLKVSHELLASPPTFWPHEWDLRAYRKLFYETNFWTYFQNTVVVAALTTVIVVIAGVIGAYSLTRYAFPGRTLVARVTLLAYMFPPIIMLVPLFLLARELGLVNSLPGLALTYISFSLPYALWILRAFFQSIPVELEHAALLDGANRAQALWYVVMPLALPGIIATAIFTFIVAWNDFLFALVLTRTEVVTYTVQVTHYFGGQSNFWAKIAAMSVLGTIPVFFAVATLQRYLVRGISMGAVKG